MNNFERPTSKTSVKRELKRQRIEAKYKRMKQERKSMRASAVTVDARATWQAEGVLPIRQERNAMLRADFESRCERGPIVIIDCDWGEKMTQKELVSLTQQIMYSYSANKQSRTPVRLWAVGVSIEQQALLSKLPGFNSWYMIMTPLRLEELNLLRDTIYLTADAHDSLDLQRVSKDTAMVVGGIVDRNRHKNATLLKSEKLQLRNAQLPIGDFMPMKTSKVLTVNHVVQILVHALEHHDWKSALDSAIPDRKRAE
jgi:tRNA (guanine9-N1)-methyltransferase